MYLFSNKPPAKPSPVAKAVESKVQGTTVDPKTNLGGKDLCKGNWKPLPTQKKGK
jgi:hypothetical protein